MFTRRRRTGEIRAVGAYDQRLLEAAAELCARTPVMAVMLRRHVDELLGRRGAAGELFVRIADGEVDAALWAGANLIPFGAPSAIAEFASIAARRGRRCSSIVGEAALVEDLWARLSKTWSRPRAERLNQPVLVHGGTSRVSPDPDVRIATRADAALVVPAAIAMYTEEVGYDPRRFGSGYEHHICTQVAQGRAFVRVGPADGPPVVFTAEVGALAGGVAQIHGVWVAPELRGQGIGSHAMARVCELTAAHHAGTVSLYVNDYNTPALRMYEKTGFDQVGTFATILF